MQVKIRTGRKVCNAESIPGFKTIARKNAYSAETVVSAPPESRT
jgi:hypothetical protein